MIAALLLALPATDQWSPMFDHGDRWPTCTVTYSANLHTKTLRRAALDITRASGIHLEWVAQGGQINVQQTTDDSPGRLAEALPTAGADGRYVAATVIGWGGLLHYQSWYRRLVWRHELGHALGLGHTSDPTDLMFFGGVTNGQGSGWVDALTALYPECAGARR